MATVTEMSTVHQVSQPRGVSKLVNITSFNTRQTAMLGSNTWNPLKRSREHGLDINDMGQLNPPTKRSKTWLDHTFQSKSTFAPTMPTRIIYPLPKPRRILQAYKNSFAPLPTRAKAGHAAGARLKVAVLNRQKINGSNQLGLPKDSGQAGSLAVSLEAILSRTVSSCNASVGITTLAAVNTTVFEIHEDMADEEMGNLLTHSANALDISDDENRITAKMDRGKENVPPMDDNHDVASISSVIHAARKAITRTKPRIPLGSLNVADFCPQASVVDSVIIVPTETGWY